MQANQSNGDHVVIPADFRPQLIGDLEAEAALFDADAARNGEDHASLDHWAGRNRAWAAEIKYTGALTLPSDDRKDDVAGSDLGALLSFIEAAGRLTGCAFDIEPPDAEHWRVLSGYASLRADLPA
jgi:hypothetical protein